MSSRASEKLQVCSGCSPTCPLAQLCPQPPPAWPRLSLLLLVPPFLHHPLSFPLYLLHLALFRHPLPHRPVSHLAASEDDSKLMCALKCTHGMWWPDFSCLSRASGSSGFLFWLICVREAHGRRLCVRHSLFGLFCNETMAASLSCVPSSLVLVLAFHSMLLSASVEAVVRSCLHPLQTLSLPCFICHSLLSPFGGMVYSVAAFIFPLNLVLLSFCGNGQMYRVAAFVFPLNAALHLCVDNVVCGSAWNSSRSLPECMIPTTLQHY